MAAADVCYFLHLKMYAIAWAHLTLTSLYRSNRNMLEVFNDRRMLIHCSSLVGAPPFLIDRPRTNFCFVVPLLISRVNSRQTVG